MTASINDIDENFLPMRMVHLRDEIRKGTFVFLGQCYVDSGQFSLMAISHRNRGKCRLNDSKIPLSLEAM